MIDYVMGYEGVRDRIKSMRVGENIESDHQSLEVWAKGEREREGKERKETVVKERWGIWSGEGYKKRR